MAMAKMVSQKKIWLPAHGIVAMSRTKEQNARDISGVAFLSMVLFIVS